MNEGTKVTAPVIGNAIAYFIIIYLAQGSEVVVENTPEAVAMGGAIVTYVLMQFNKIVSWTGGLISSKIGGSD